MVVHAGWGMTQGRTFCGRHSERIQTSMQQSDITCQRCVRTLLGDAERDVRAQEAVWLAAVKDRNELERQLLKLQRNSGVVL